jgi:hypothetical protein
VFYQLIGVVGKETPFVSRLFDAVYWDGGGNGMPVDGPVECDFDRLRLLKCFFELFRRIDGGECPAVDNAHPITQAARLLDIVGGQENRSSLVVHLSDGRANQPLAVHVEP